MATEIWMRKIGPDYFVPAWEEDKEWNEKVPMLGFVRGEFTQLRNGANHRRFFVLLKIAYDLWLGPAAMPYRGSWITPEKNFDEFRKWIIVECGYYDVIGYPNGAVRVRAKSIKFSKMGEDEFQKLFSTAIDVILKYIMHGRKLPDLERAVLEFAG